ncbi:MAG: hypothetical protein O7G85_07710, partial [Planctomycetota bacterium]|nr:hypothetical protein [Planctomycetota bacterium]
SFPTVTNCSFNGNTAANVGGGIYNTFGGNPTVTNTGFCFNTPDQIDGAYTDGGGNALQYCGPPIPAPNPCPADTTGPSGVPDGIVDVEDLLLLLGAWGACP